MHLSSSMSSTLRYLSNVRYKSFNQLFVFYQKSRSFSLLPQSSQIYSEELLSRSLVQLKGHDSATLLQGLITNDVEHLLNGAPSMYAMFLNNKGRVKFDAIIYKTPEEMQFLIEIDKKMVPSLIKHLKLYKLKKNVELSDPDSYRILSLLDIREVLNCLPKPLFDSASKIFREKYNLSFDFNASDGSLSCIDDIKMPSSVLKCRDPRVQALGMRLVCPKETDLKEELSGQGVILPSQTESLYKLCRYLLGVAEGYDEMPEEKSFPLELNADYLHGVSFHKGCYIGQELTARTYHTGVIRKRLMPVTLDDYCNPHENISVPASTETPKSIGKLRGTVGLLGLAVLRTLEGLNASNLIIGSCTGHCFKPIWWPQQCNK